MAANHRTNNVLTKCTLFSTLLVQRMGGVECLNQRLHLEFPMMKKN